MAKKETKGKSKSKSKKTDDALESMASILMGGVKEADMDAFYPPFKNPVGRPLKFTPEELAEEFAKYVEWCRKHPLKAKSSSKTFGANTMFHEETEARPRLVSISGFLVFVGGSDSWWSNLESGINGEAFLKVKGGISKYCESYQLEMASAGFLKQNIISRLLGLSDKKEVKATGASFKIEVEDTDTADVLKKIMNGETDEDN